MANIILQVDPEHVSRVLSMPRMARLHTLGLHHQREDFRVVTLSKDKDKHKHKHRHKHKYEYKFKYKYIYNLHHQREDFRVVTISRDKRQT